MSRFCASCGSAIEGNETVCPTCGEPTGAVGDAPLAEVRADARTEEIASASLPSPRPLPLEGGAVRKGASSSSGRDYLLAGVGALVLASLIFLVAPEHHPPVTVEEVRRTMQEKNGGAPEEGMPEGHPNVNEQMPQGPQVTPEQEKEIADLEGKLQANPKDMKAAFDLAGRLFEVERYDKALPLLQGYVKANPGNDSSRAMLAYTLAASGDLDGAIGEMKRVIGKNPKDQEVAFMLSRTYFYKAMEGKKNSQDAAAKKDIDSAMQWLRTTQQIDPASKYGTASAEMLEKLEKPHGGVDSTGKGQ